MHAQTSQVATFDDMDRINHRRNESQASKTRIACLAVVAAAAVLGSIISFAILQSAFTSISETHWRTQTPCGGSPSEAQSRNCKFDLTSRFWVPEDCFYSQLAREFQAAKQTPYYADPNGSRILSETELPYYTSEIYTTGDYHRLHCMFLLRRNHLAVRSGGKLPALMTSYEHTEHCIDALSGKIQGPDIDEIHPIFDMQFPPCVGAREALSLKGEER